MEERDRALPRVRARTVAAGLYLIGLPTAYQLFDAEIGGRQLGVRIALAAVWVAVAAWLGAGAARREDVVDRIAAAEEERQRNTAEELTEGWEHAIADAVKALVEQAKRDTGHEHRLFRPEGDVLVPIYDPSHQRWQRWASRQGVVGWAWDRDILLHLHGDQLLDPILGLTGEQRDRYGDLRTVAAVPVWSSAGRKLGVLSWSSRDDRPHTDESDAALLARASTIGVLLERVLDET